MEKPVPKINIQKIKDYFELKVIGKQDFVEFSISRDID